MISENVSFWMLSKLLRLYYDLLSYVIRSIIISSRAAYERVRPEMFTLPISVAKS